MSKNDLLLILKEPKDPVINKFTCNIMPDLYNIICSYLLEDFDPVESLKLAEINPHIYPYQQYTQDFLNYKIGVFDLVDKEIEEKFKGLDKILEGTDDLFQIMKRSMLVQDCVDYVINQFKKCNLHVPINNILYYCINTKILRVKICCKEYDISHDHEKLFINCIGLRYELLSFFWKLVLWIIVMDSI